jgi:tetratricopeptide (TPR) repeat protein
LRLVILMLTAFATASAFQGATTLPIPPETSPAPPAIGPSEAAKKLTPEARGDIFMARKQYREAIDVYGEVEPKTAVVLNKVGIAHQHLGDLSGAKKNYEASIKLNPKYPEAINNLGTVYYADKSYRRSVHYYKKALVEAPDSASIHSNLGTAYFARKDYAGAAKEYDIAIKLDPDVFERKGTHGVLLQERSVAERARYYFYVSKTYAKSGQDERALQYMRRAIEEGFKDKAKFTEDADFAHLRTNPEFVELLKLEPRVL